MFTIDSFILDFAIMSSFLFLAKLLRAKIPFLRNCFVPMSLIAGLLALLLGQYGLGIIPFSNHIASYSGTLMVCLSASLFLGNNTKLSFGKICQQVGDSFLINCASEIGQFGLFTLLGFAVAQIFRNISPWIGILLPAGFVGSHGTAAVMSPVLEEAGYSQAFSVGQTFATVGLITGIFGGVAFINYAVKRKYTVLIHSMDELPEDMRNDDIPLHRQESAGKVTVNSIAVDTLAFHIMLVLCAVALANLLSWLLGLLIPSFEVPVYALAFVCGMLMQQLLKGLNMSQNVDRSTIVHISGALTDYIVAFGVAAVDLKTVVQYWPPILLLCAIGILFSSLMLFVVSRRCFRNMWFERGIFVFGWSSAAMPVAMMLLRIVDPNYSSDVLEDANMAWIFLNFVDLILVTFLPVLLVNGYGMAVGIVLTVIAAAMLLICRVKYGPNA